MRTTIRRAVWLGLIAVTSTFAIAAPAWSDDDRGRDRQQRNQGRRDHDGRDHDGRYHGHANQHRAVDRDRRDRAGSHDRRDHGGSQTWREHKAVEQRAAHHARAHEWARRRELERHRAAATWRFEHGRGWRHFHSGAWSPFQVWWLIGGRPLLRPVPVVRVVSYPMGRYELRGDGFLVPFRWVWVPTVIVAVPPPIPAPPDAVFPEPPPYAYPPPPGS